MEKISSIISLCVALLILLASFGQWWNIGYDGKLVTKTWVKAILVISVAGVAVSLVLVLRT